MGGLGINLRGVGGENWGMNVIKICCIHVLSPQRINKKSQIEYCFIRRNIALLNSLNLPGKDDNIIEMSFVCRLCNWF